MGRPVEEDDLHARIDGQLAHDRAEDLDAYLAANPEEQARFSQYAAQRQALRQAFVECRRADTGPPGDRKPGRAAASPAAPPGRSDRRSRGHDRHRRHRRLGCTGAHRSAKLVAARRGRTLITANAITAYRTYSVEVRHPVEVDAGQEAHLVQWLSKRLGRQLVVPDLASAGFRLMGGRLLPAKDGQAAKFMYENGNAER